MALRAGMPTTVRAGLAVACAGALVDVVQHAAGASDTTAGHLVVIAGMVVTLGGLFRLARSQSAVPHDMEGGKR